MGSIYTNEGRANTSNVPININSTRDDMYWGYPKWSDYKKFSANTPLKNMYPGLLYYKH